MKPMNLEQYINYIAVDICESVDLMPSDEVTEVLEQVITAHIDQLCHRVTRCSLKKPLVN